MGSAHSFRHSSRRGQVTSFANRSVHVKVGPDLPFEATDDAAPHRHRSGHSCMSQHLSWAKVGRANLTALAKQMVFQTARVKFWSTVQVQVVEIKPSCDTSTAMRFSELDAVATLERAL